MSEEKRAAMARERMALELRLGGNTLAQCAELMGITSEYGVQIVAALIRRALQRDIKEWTIEETRELEAARLDKLVEACWPAVLASAPKAIEIVLKIMERRAWLLGLDMPKQINLGGGTLTAKDLEQLREERWAQMKDTPVGSLLMSPNAFADPEEIIEGEWKDGARVEAGQHGAGGGDGDDAGGDGANEDSSEQPDDVDRTDAGVPGKADAGSGADEQHRYTEVAVSKTKWRYPHLHPGGLSSAVRTRKGERDE